MSERREEFEELLERTLRGRVNVAAPEEMVERIAVAAGRELVVVRRGVGMWATAMAACLVMMVAGAFYGWRRGGAVKPGGSAVVSAPVGVGRVAVHAAVSVPVVARVRRVAWGGGGGVEAAKVRAVREEESGPKLEVFPYSAVHEEVGRTDGVQAEVKMLASVPESTLVLLAEAQAKELKEAGLPSADVDGN
jgi:hypothetical protein